MSFRIEFNLELSETMLGHSKLTGLLQDSRFADICSVRLEPQGYLVVEKTERANILNLSRESSSRATQFCIEEPLCLEDVTGVIDVVDFGVTPGPFCCLKSPVGMSKFCQEEPLCLADAGDSSPAGSEPTPEMLMFAPTPGPFAPTPVPDSATARACSTEHNASCLTELLPLYLQMVHSAGEPDGSETFIGDVMKPDSAEIRQTLFCEDEPLSFDDLSDSSLAYGFGPSPGPCGWTPISAWGTRPTDLLVQSSPVLTGDGFVCASQARQAPKSGEAQLPRMQESMRGKIKSVPWTAPTQSALSRPPLVPGHVRWSGAMENLSDTDSTRSVVSSSGDESIDCSPRLEELFPDTIADCGTHSQRFCPGEGLVLDDLWQSDEPSRPCSLLASPMPPTPSPLATSVWQPLLPCPATSFASKLFPVDSIHRPPLLHLSDHLLWN